MAEACAAREAISLAEGTLSAEREKVKSLSETVESAETRVKELEERQEATAGAEHEATKALLEEKV